MLTDLTEDRLYASLLARDPSLEGQVWVCVRTTGIFCRLTCPARKPRRENTLFKNSVAACLEAGFRPCKRCRPLSPNAEQAPLVARLLSMLEADPARKWSEADLAAVGIDPSTARRAFRRAFGTTFLEVARLSRLRAAAALRSAGASVIEAQLEAGYESGSGFRAAFTRLLGSAPGALSGEEKLAADWIDTPLGPMVAVADRSRLWLLEFMDRRALPSELDAVRQAAGAAIGLGRFPPTESIALELSAYFAGAADGFATPLAPYGSPFARSVWAALRRIPYGRTCSYGDIAAALGRPGAARAVARANGANRFALIVPCHRVVASDGGLAGYGGGLWRKKWLIEHERRRAAACLSEGVDP
jgi:AraC family transcriptional regulator of adaptative response/methylated-DNA-[protein]-cysteine methyltransferase